VILTGLSTLSFIKSWLIADAMICSGVLGCLPLLPDVSLLTSAVLLAAFWFSLAGASGSGFN
jgi:hypothetical protein